MTFVRTHLALWALVACGSGSSSETDTTPEDADADADADTDSDADADADTDADTDGPTSGETGDPVGDGWVAPRWVAGLPNIDSPDDFSRANPLDDELAPFTIVPGPEPADSVRLRLGGGVALRVWHDGRVLLDAGTTEATLPWSAAPLELGLELASYKLEDTLTVETITGGQATARTTTRLRSGEMFLNHHLLPTELVVMVQTGTNAAMLNVLRTQLGQQFETASGTTYRGDVWIQDELEFSWATTPDDRMDMVIDSIRDRGLDDYPEDRFRGEDFASHTFGDEEANTLDSFGNLEVTPPIAGFPAGRIYYGGFGTYVPQDAELHAFLDAQQVQQPLELDTSWLCVGHVDEIMSFVPDATAPRGFRFVYSDIPLARQLLESMPATTRLPRWEGRANHNYDTVGEILADTGLWQLNDDLQADHLDPILAQVTAEWSLTPDEIVLIPALFEEPSGCGRQVAALIPGMANLLVSNLPTGQTKVFLADPFLRSDLGNQATDPLITYVRDALPSTLQTYFVDDWSTYHLALGEVHCGTNTIRTPEYAWWVDELDGGAP